jgi:hypothetical protein
MGGSFEQLGIARYKHFRRPRYRRCNDPLIARIPQLESTGLRWFGADFDRPEYFFCRRNTIRRKAKLVLQHSPKLGDDHFSQDELVLR